MAILNLPDLDDPIGTDSCPGFSGGQRSYGPPDQLQAMEAYALTNIDIQDGTATTRRGAEVLGSGTDTFLGNRVQGMIWYDTPATELLIAIVDGAAWQYTGGAWGSMAGSYTATNATGQVCMAQLVEKLYIVDGTANLIVWDGSSFTDLGNTTGNPGEPPAGASIAISAYGCLWLAGFSDVTDSLWVSKYLDAGTTGWYADNGNIRVGEGEGDPITGLCEWDGFRIVVFKRNSIWIMQIDPRALTFGSFDAGLGSATLTKISDTIGCVSHRSIARVGNDVWFLSDNGIYSVGRVIAQDVREIKQEASLPVHDIINRINPAQFSKAAGAFWNNRYLLALPLDDDTEPSTVLVYSTHKQAWTGLWTGWSPICWALSKASGEERLNFGRPDGTVWRWLDYVPVSDEVETTFRDAGEDFTSSILTRAAIFSDATNSKSLMTCQVEFFASQAQASVGIRLDEQEPITLNSGFDTSTGTLTLPFTLPATLPALGLKRRAFGCQHLPQFRSVQAFVSTNAGKLSLRAVIFNGFLNTIRLEQ